MAELIRRADTARYAAKASGVQLVEYGPELDERAEAAERLGADLRHSLDDGDFQVVYQPIIDLRDERTVAVEALVRWTHPVRGPVSPVAFIPAAEDNGLIVEPGEWIMRTVCRQFAAWRTALGSEAPLYISVNVSPRQLSEPGFPAVVFGSWPTPASNRHCHAAGSAGSGQRAWRSGSAAVVVRGGGRPAGSLLCIGSARRPP